jgi:hypothetical protein
VIARLLILPDELYRKRFLPSKTDAELDHLAGIALHEKPALSKCPLATHNTRNTSPARRKVEKFMRIAFCKLCFTVTLAFVLNAPPLDAVWSQDASAPSAGPTLVKAVMCESIQELTPVNQAIVFSIGLGRVSCFTEFDQVVERTVIYHKWYHRGELISAKQLSLSPPRWSSSSSMQLRARDKGPWQVDITDENNNVMYSLRFSITD